MTLEIISPKGLLFKGEINAATFPGSAGSFDVLPHHAPLISSLKKGTILFESQGEKKEQAIESGFVEVMDDQVSVCIE